ncbi:MAG: heme o synthase [Planctomycetota bacterium]|nr:heme o synthase [Planctomycetota bacterium]
MSQINRLAIPAAEVAGHRAAAINAAVELTKPGITRMVVITAGVGFAMAAFARPWAPVDLLLTAVFCLLGTALSASGANALNQWMERSRDALMRRTTRRPIPDGRLSSSTAFALGAALSILGVATLALLVNPAAAAVSAATILIYLLVYTTLKPVTPLATIIGAAPGALPPLIGWCAAAQTDASSWSALLQPGGWALFLIMFVWQIPHFLAIAWMHREDYARGGHRVLPVIDPEGARTAPVTFLWALAIIPVSLMAAPLMPAQPGVAYFLVAVITGALFARAAWRFANKRDNASARKVFIASIIHLPLLLIAMVADAGLSLVI